MFWKAYQRIAGSVLPLILIMLGLCLPHALRSQDSPFRFRQYLKKDGLNNSNINALLQDEKGFLWITTENGLNRFDGKKIINYNHVDFVGTNPIKDIDQDNSGKLWLLVKGQIVFLDPITQKSQVCTDSLANIAEILCLFKDSQGKMWLGMRDGNLVRYSLDDQLFTHHKLPSGRDKGSLVYDIIEDQHEDLWIGTNRGLWKFDTDISQHEKAFTHYLHDPQNENSISGNLAWRISLALDGSLWIACWKEGVDQFFPSTGEVKHFGQKEGLGSTSIRSIFSDSQGNVWAGSNDQGLFILPSGGDKFKEYAYLGTTYIQSFYEDRSGGIWVSTYAGGLHHYSRFREKFIHIKQEENNPNSLNHNLVFSILETQLLGKKNLWIGTHGGGLNQMIEDPITGDVQFYSHKTEAGNPRSIVGDVILGIKEDSNGDLWIASFTGLCKFSKGAQVRFLQGKPAVFQRIGNKEGINPGPIWTSFIDKKGNVWASTNGGIYVLAPGETRFTFTRYKNLVTRAMLASQDGDIFLGTTQGLFFIDRPAGPFKIEALWTDPLYVDILCLYEDTKQRLWIGTEGRGLFVRMKDGKVMQLDLDEGLPGSSVEGIMEDKKNRLWVSTNDGMSVFYPDSVLKHMDDPSSFIRTYDVLDGLQENEFAEGACYQNEKGVMYFGGINGLTTFDPLTIRDNPHPPATYLTGLRILDKDIQIGDLRENGKPILTKDICAMDRLSIGYRDFGFTFSFAAMDFSAPDKNQYAHYLEGFEKTWVQDGAKNFATYTNLDPGSYTFHVKASNNDHVWGEETQSIRIHVYPPPWRAWWAYTLYFLLVSGAVIGYFRFRLREKEKVFETRQRIEKAKIEERERVRKNTAADFHDELGNKMTKISLFSELAKRSSADPNMLKVYLNQVEENTRSLSAGVRDFIWVLDPGKDALYEVLFRIKDFGDQLFEHSDIQFVATQIEEGRFSISVPLELRRQIVMICKEALNNALKYAKAKKVNFSATLNDNELHIQIKDDGQGFDPQAAHEGYGLGNMKQRAEKMNADLDINSQKDQGAEISLRVNLPHMGD